MPLAPLPQRSQVCLAPSSSGVAHLPPELTICHESGDIHKEEHCSCVGLARVKPKAGAKTATDMLVRILCVCLRVCVPVCANKYTEGAFLCVADVSPLQLTPVGTTNSAFRGDVTCMWVEDMGQSPIDFFVFHAFS